MPLPAATSAPLAPPRPREPSPHAARRRRRRFAGLSEGERRAQWAAYRSDRKHYTAEWDKQGQLGLVFKEERGRKRESLVIMLPL